MLRASELHHRGITLTRQVQHMLSQADTCAEAPRMTHAAFIMAVVAEDAHKSWFVSRDGQQFIEVGSDPSSAPPEHIADILNDLAIRWSIRELAEFGRVEVRLIRS